MPRGVPKAGYRRFHAVSGHMRNTSRGMVSVSAHGRGRDVELDDATLAIVGLLLGPVALWIGFGMPDMPWWFNTAAVLIGLGGIGYGVSYFTGKINAALAAARKERARHFRLVMTPEERAFQQALQLPFDRFRTSGATLVLASDHMLLTNAAVRTLEGGQYFTSDAPVCALQVHSTETWAFTRTHLLVFQTNTFLKSDTLTAAVPIDTLKLYHGHEVSESRWGGHHFDHWWTVHLQVQTFAPPATGNGGRPAGYPISTPYLRKDHHAVHTTAFLGELAETLIRAGYPRAERQPTDEERRTLNSWVAR